LVTWHKAAEQAQTAKTFLKVLKGVREVYPKMTRWRQVAMSMHVFAARRNKGSWVYTTYERHWATPANVKDVDSYNTANCIFNKAKLDTIRPTTLDKYRSYAETFLAKERKCSVN
jgi:hypothetical protein